MSTPDDNISWTRKVILRNAAENPNYAPYCGPCPGLVRMKKIEPLYWRCDRCGAEHDERPGAREERNPMRDTRTMTRQELTAELEALAKRWKAFRADLDAESGGGSPGEWMVERMDELETALRRSRP